MPLVTAGQTWRDPGVPGEGLGGAPPRHKAVLSAGLGLGLGLAAEQSPLEGFGGCPCRM